MLPVSINLSSGLVLLTLTRIWKSQKFAQNTLWFRNRTLATDMCQLLRFLLHLEERRHLLVHGAGRCRMVGPRGIRV